MELSFHDITSFIALIDGSGPVLKYSAYVAIGAFMVGKSVLKDRKIKKRTADAVSTAVAIQKAGDNADRNESTLLDERVEEILSPLYSRMYNAIEKYVYGGGANGYRHITIIKHKEPVDVPANRFLSEYLKATKASIYKKAKPFIIRQLALHNVATETQESKTNDGICVEIRSMIISKIHIDAGSNTETKEMEDEIFSFASILDIYVEISTACDLLRHQRNQEVADSIRSVES